MIRFIWQNWWRHKERFILLLVGTLILSTGLSYLFGLTQSNTGTIVNSLQKHWHASYDIVVRPPGTRSLTEDKNLLEPNYLSGIVGGISIDQYDQIKKMDGIDVAAPISMIGYTAFSVLLKKVDVPDKGIYRIHHQVISNNGIHQIIPEFGTYNSYRTKTLRPYRGDSRTPIFGFTGNLTGGVTYLLAGIDPEAEAKLVGLDQAILPLGESRYFQPQDQAQVLSKEHGGKYNIPVIVNSHAFIDKKIKYTIQKLDLPSDPAGVFDTIQKIKEKSGAFDIKPHHGADFDPKYEQARLKAVRKAQKYLNSVDTVEGTKQTYSFSAQLALNHFLTRITGVNPKTGKPSSKKYKQDFAFPSIYYIGAKPTGLDLHPGVSPFPKRWPFAYKPKVSTLKYEGKLGVEKSKEIYRPVQTFADIPLNLPSFQANWVGVYDPMKLNISKDPLTKLPMDAYRPPSAKWVLDAQNNPVNPPVKMKPFDKAYGLLSKPPTMLTTIDAAAKILGDKPISAIRILVGGVDDLSEASQNKLERIARDIEDQTGLIADITLGSSPQPALTHVPGINDRPELGWIAQPWVKLGSSFTIFQETQVGFSGIIASVIFVAIVYVFASCLVSLLARRREFAVLLAVGWQPQKLAKLLFLESALLGGFVAVVAWTILGWVLTTQGAHVSLLRLGLAGLFGFVIYGLGAIIPAILSTRIRPYEAMQSGEISKTSRRIVRTRSLLSMALSHFMGKWRRSLLSVVAIAVPTGLLAFFLFVTFRLKGVMYTTWLGQYAALEVGPTHYVAMGIALLIAILTTAEIMWQNISERQPEFALLKAIGWRNGGIRLLVFLEGGFNGLLAGILGLGFAFGLIWGLYQQFPQNQIGFLLLTGLIPLITGFTGAALPAEKAVRIQPSEGMRGQFSNQKKTERRLRWVLGIAAALLIIAFGVMIYGIVEAL